jgi:hypothetical protein
MGYFRSPGYSNLPYSLEPMGPEDEANVMLSMIRWLNEKFLLDLGEDVELQERNAQALEGTAE